MKLQLFMDVECYVNYFLVMFMAPTGQTKSFEMYDGHELDRDGLRKYLENNKVEIVTFNGNTYDLPIIKLALKPTTTTSLLKKASSDIIDNDLKPWDFERRYNTKDVDVDHVDLIEVAPGQVGLKIYGGRLHCDELQDLPYPHDAVLTREQMIEVKKYCHKDLKNTSKLAKELEEQVNLRRTMSEEYGVDLRSKSDAQIAEAVLKAEIYKATGVMPKKIPINYSEFFYEPPSYVQFLTWPMKQMLATIKSAKMVIKPDTGHVEMPEAIEKLDIEISEKKYKVGIGGLHSQESCASHYADEDTIIRDADVASYYPNLMLNMGMYPEALGPAFLTTYRNILNERLAAKHAGDTVKANSLKITLNGTFGKTSNKYSILYNPKFMIATTITGQLSLLMLIEALEVRGISVISANTDGVVAKFSKDKLPLYEECVAIWQKISNLELEFTDYSSIHSRDVNNYVAITTKGKVKTKGVYAKPGIAKNPQNEICSEAVVEYLTKGTPIEETVRGCTDIRKFIVLRKVDGGAVKGTKYLGKAIRWYYSYDVEGPITYKNTGNSVPMTEGAQHLMDLPEEFPEDVNHEWYIMEARNILKEIGAVVVKEMPKLPRKNTKLWKSLVEEGKIVANHKGEWMWKEHL